MPKRFDNNSTAYFPTSAKEKYRRIFFEVIDQILMSINTRFDSDFDISRHRDMFFDVIKDQNIELIRDLSQISIFLQDHKDIREFCSEYSKFIKLMLTSPQTVCIAERSFSGLKRQKTYLRSTSGQQRTNSLALLNHHREIANEIDLDVIADDFISRCVTRGNTFAFKKEM